MFLISVILFILGVIYFVVSSDLIYVTYFLGTEILAYNIAIQHAILQVLSLIISISIFCLYYTIIVGLFKHPHKNSSIWKSSFYDIGIMIDTDHNQI